MRLLVEIVQDARVGEYLIQQFGNVCAHLSRERDRHVAQLVERLHFTAVLMEPRLGVAT